jgi:hypothetical protein
MDFISVHMSRQSLTSSKSGIEFRQAKCADFLLWTRGISVFQTECPSARACMGVTASLPHGDLYLPGELYGC